LLLFTVRGKDHIRREKTTGIFYRQRERPYREGKDHWYFLPSEGKTRSRWERPDQREGPYVLFKIIGKDQIRGGRTIVTF
jgi:hypothetical protein